MGPILSLNGPSDKPGTIHFTRIAVERARLHVEPHPDDGRAF